MLDPWNEIMRDAATGVSGQYIIERDDGRVETLEVSDYAQIFPEWSEVERLAITHAKGKVLDIGCGAGRVALYLQTLGHVVVGIDTAQGAVKVCKMLGLKEAYVMSALDLKFKEGTFDTVVLFGNNLGIAGNETLAMLRKLHRITTPHAIILAGSADAESTDNENHLKYHTMNKTRNRPPGLVRIRVKYKEKISSWSDLWLVTPSELETLAEESGWKIDKIYRTGKINQAAYVAILSKR
jgi:SAM-dependent methyltransferase